MRHFYIFCSREYFCSQKKKQVLSLVNFSKSVGLLGEAISFLPFKINIITIYPIINDIS